MYKQLVKFINNRLFYVISLLIISLFIYHNNVYAACDNPPECGSGAPEDLCNYDTQNCIAKCCVDKTPGGGGAGGGGGGGASYPVIGAFENSSCSYFDGWGVDTNPLRTGSAITIRIKSGATTWTTTTDIYRADVNAAFGITGTHGFTYPTPAVLKDGLPHSISVYGVSIADGTEFQLTGSPKTITCPPPPVCTVTAPSNPSVTTTSDATSSTAILNWVDGSGGTLQLIRMDDDRTQVETGCPGGCIVSGSIPLTDRRYPAVGAITGLTPNTTYYWRIVEYVDGTNWKDFGNQCVYSVSANFTTPPPPATCTVDLQPSSATVASGGSVTFTANVTSTNGTVDSVYFTSSDENVATIYPETDNSPSYSTVATGYNVGTTTITANVIMNGVLTCSDTSPTVLSVTPANAWWQVKDADVTTLSDITSGVPSGKVFSDVGSGGYAGIPTYAGSLSTTPGTTSTSNWNAKTQTTNPKVFDYSYFENLVPEDITFNNASDISTAQTSQYGYEWFKFDGSTGPTAGQDMSISSDINFGSRRVILFVKGADLNINAKINLLDNNGFFMVVVDGNININPTVTSGGATPAVEGLFVSNRLSTGNGTSQLYLRGSVASYGNPGIYLERSLSNNSNPAELFEYAPDLILLYPPKLGFKQTKWVEVAP